MADSVEHENSENCEEDQALVPDSNGDVSERGDDDGNAEVASSQNEREQYQPTKFESFMAITKSLIIRALVIYFITSFFRQPRPTQQPGAEPGASPQLTKVPAFNLFENGTFYDFFMYLSERKMFDDFENPETLFWSKTGLMYGDWLSGTNNDGSYVHSAIITPSEKLKNNGSLYLHVYVTKKGYSPNPRSGKSYAGQMMSYSRRQLNKFKRQKFMKTHNLLTGETALTPEQIRIAESMKVEIVSHWHPNLTVNLVTDQSNWMKGAVPPPLDEYIEFTPTGDRYKPVLFMNDFWNMQRDYQPINKTVDSLELRLTFQPMSLFYWQLYSAQAMRNKWSSMNFLGDALGHEEEEEDQDSLKEALLETSPYLLALTIFVSILHSVFELLAFKNDIQFWNNRKSLEGLSVRSVFFNVFQSLIVLLYVLDNDTNTIVRISCFVGLGIEIWKINKVMDVKINRESKLFGVIPTLQFTDKGSYIESSTREYDIMAFKYLSWAVYPLLIGYGIYSLLYQEHKGWYSWVLSMLYGFLLTFGFIMMTPQLFINYKLKSVAHLPWRMMTYKALNTFIDDIFAFVIKMPTMYRIGCFRDDIVFFIFLYQKFIYKTDPTRVNEFGFSAEMEEDAKKQVAVVDNKSNGAVKETSKKTPRKTLANKKKD